MKYLLFKIIILVLTTGAFAQHESLIINIRNRNVTSLNGKWRYIPDINKKNMGFEHTKIPEKKWDIHEHNFPSSDWLYVPGDWNSQKEDLKFYEGKLWYQTYFFYDLPKDKRLFIYFGAANYKTTVFVNGVHLGTHIGGFTPFNFEISDTILKKRNSLVVSVDNTRDVNGIPPFETDWWNYGGITRDVYLAEFNNVFVRDYLVELKKGTNNVIQGYVQLSNALPDVEIDIFIPEKSKHIKRKTDEKGRFQFESRIPGLMLWDVKNPKLYDIHIKVKDNLLHDKIGFRSIEAQGNDILLNGKPVFLRGICIHEESPLREGRAWSAEDALILLNRAKELHCNFVRLAHYPHNEHMYRLADEMGLMVWEELPLYWSVNWDNKQTYQLAENMLTEMITRDKNRAGIIVWSMANETGDNPARNRFLSNLIAETRRIDDSRLISAALHINGKESDKYTKVVNDKLGKQLDIICVNEYFGWYQGLPGIIDSINWDIQFNKPFLFSEFGAGALQGFHGDSLTRWSEEYQDYYYKETIEMLDRIPELRGITPWLLVDFKSPRRLFPYIQDFYNKKGLYSERGEKKKAFYTLMKYYQKIEKSE